MSSVQRTPPNTLKMPTNNLCQSQTKSESDIANAVVNDYVNTNRNKRARKANSPQGAATLSSHDLQTQLADWKEEQDSSIAKLMATQTAVMAKLASDIGEIKSQNSQIQASNADIYKSNEEIARSMSFINQQFEELKKEVEDLRKERQEQRQYIENLEKRLHDLQHKSRSSGIEIRNIPQSNTETNATLAKTICSIGEAVGVSIKDSELRDIYRLPGKSSSASTTTRPIIAEFSSVLKKETLISAVRTFNKAKVKEDKLNTGLIGIPGSCQPVYVTEQLPGNTKNCFINQESLRKIISSNSAGFPTATYFCGKRKETNNCLSAPRNVYRIKITLACDW